MSPGITIDEISFEKLYKKHWLRLYQFACSLLQDEEMAKEIVQEVFKSIWERRHTLAIQDIESYLVRSVKMKTFTMIRNQQTQRIHHDIIEKNINSYYTEEPLLGKELGEKINTLVEELPKQCRRVFQLSRQEGLTNKQIAHELFISERAVEYHISKALQTLRKELVEYI